MKKSLIIPFSLLAFLSIMNVSCKKKTTEVDPGVESASPSNAVISTVSPVIGQMGTTVYINGRGFSESPEDNMILFGGTRVAATKGTSERLVVEVPKDAESGHLRVQVNGNLSLASHEYFTVKHSQPLFRGWGEDAIRLGNLSSEFARASSVLVQEGSRSIVQHGHEWTPASGVAQLNGSPEQTELGPIGNGGVVPYKFISYLRNLQPNTTYTIRPYVLIKGVGKIYGPIREFTTPKE